MKVYSLLFAVDDPLWPTSSSWGEQILWVLGYIIVFIVGWYLFEKSRSLEERKCLQRDIKIYLIRQYLKAFESRRFLDMTHLLELGVDVDSNDDGHSPLFKAAGEGDLDMIKYLLLEKADVNFSLSYGCSVLGHASENGCLDTVTLLLEKGANADSNALRYAARGGNLDIVTMLLASGACADRDALNSAAANGHVRIAMLLLANADFSSEDLSSPLRGAANFGHPGIVGLLVEHGADISVIGQPPRSLTMSSGYSDIAALFE